MPILISLGGSALAFALITALYGTLMGWLSASSRSEPMLVSTVRAVRLTAGLVTLSCLGLWAAFLQDRFDVEYVAAYSSRELPLAYKLAALWGGQKGSLLLWALILAIYALVIVRPKKSGDPALMAGVASVLMAIMSFFLVIANFSTPPFERVLDVMPDGRGLNPLLQHPAMAIHPPALYVGFVGMAVPFAFMITSLCLGRLDDRWIRMSRKPTLVAWTALFIGNLLGMAWAYMELGWGGYWGWDPVENAALMPLLTGTAYLHSVMIQERRGMLKMWNASLVAITFLLTIFGTFLTRSGVVSSVHSFGASTLGSYFLAFLGGCVAFTLYVLFTRRRLLESEHRLDSLWSREAAFIANNIILVGAAFSILWGTTYPVLSEAVAGAKASLGAPFYNRVNVPIAVALLVLTGVGPLIAWRRASLEQLRRSFLVPALCGIALTAALLAFGVRHVWAVTVFGLCVFVMATIAIEFARGVRARRAKHHERLPIALLQLCLRNPRRYGGYLVHVGVLLFFAGIAASSAYQIASEGLLRPGQEIAAGPYRVRLDKVERVDLGRAAGIVTTVTAKKGGRTVATLRPERLTYYTGVQREEQPTTNVAIRSSILDDLYVVPAAYFPDEGQVHLKVFLNPMVSWIWIGGVFVLFGIVVALVPVRAPRTVAVATPIPPSTDRPHPASALAPAHGA